MGDLLRSEQRTEKKRVARFDPLFVVLLAAAGAVAWLRGRNSKAAVVKKYRTLVAHTLETSSGRRDSYSAPDVTRALRETRVATQFAHCAYAMFCDAEEFAKAPGCAQLDYLELRRELELP